MMKQNLLKSWTFLIVTVMMVASSFAQDGSLFIIGGGERSDKLMQDLVSTAALSEGDYVVILPMASGVPEESADDVRTQLSRLCSNAVTTFNFNKNEANHSLPMIDSVRNARLVYITGGDQNRFMDVVRGTALYQAMHEAFDRGATIAGTSAGAAVMSEIMITGDEADKKDEGNFRVIKAGNAITATGMGFIKTAVIDQHFIKRSRYNRLMGVLADHPDKIVIGIDESTALVVKGKNAKVVGESQVVVMEKPKKLKLTKNNKVNFQEAKLRLLVSGDMLKLK